MSRPPWVSLLALGVFACQPGPQIVQIPPLSSSVQLDAPVRRQLDARYRALRAGAGTGAVARGQAWGKLGMVYHAYGYREQARAAYGNARQLDPAQAAWVLYLARVSHRLGEQGAARRGYQWLLERREEDVLVRLWLADLELETGDMEEADRHYRRILRQRPKHAGALEGRGRVALERGAYGAAIKQFRAALAVDPASPSVHHALGLALRGRGDLKAAREHLVRARSLTGVPGSSPGADDPRMAAVYDLRRGSMARDRQALRALLRGDLRGAIVAYREAVAADPENADARYNLALALFQARRRADALEELRALLAKQPGHVPANVRMGYELVRDGDFTGAEAHLRAAVQSDPGDGRARQSLGDFLAFRERFSESIASYRAAVKLDEGLEAAQVGLALNLARTGKFAPALAALRRAVPRFPDSGGLVVLYTRMLAAAPEEALRDGARALEILKPDSRRPRTVSEAESLAMALAETGRFDDAARWQQAAIAALKKDHPHRAVARARLDRYARRTPSRVPWRNKEELLFQRIEAP